MARASYQHLDGIRIGAKTPKPLTKVVKAKRPVAPAPVTTTTSFVIPKPLRAVLTLKHR